VRTIIEILNLNIVTDMSEIGPGRLDSGAKKPTMLVNVSTEMAISPGLGSSTTVASSESSSAHSTDLDSPQQWIHPFASSTAKLEILPSSANSDMIDVEEEARLYDELCRNYEEDSDSVRFIFNLSGSFDNIDPINSVCNSFIVCKIQPSNSTYLFRSRRFEDSGC
jgi:DNA polymerase III delta prime subunit